MKLKVPIRNISHACFPFSCRVPGEKRRLAHGSARVQLIQRENCGAKLNGVERVILKLTTCIAGGNHAE